MSLRTIIVLGFVLGICGIALAQPKEGGSAKEPVRSAQTLEQRLALMEQQAAKLLNDIQTIRKDIKGAKVPAVADDISIYRLKNMDVGHLVEVLGSVLSEEKNLRIIPDAATNSILVRGSDVQRKTIEALLIKLDVEAASDVAAKTDFQIITLKRALASDTAKLLSDLFRPRDGGRLSIAADARTNSLVVQGRTQDLELIQAIVARLDAQPDAEWNTPAPKVEKRSKKD